MIVDYQVWICKRCRIQVLNHPYIFVVSWIAFNHYSYDHMVLIDPTIGAAWLRKIFILLHCFSFSFFLKMFFFFVCNWSKGAIVTPAIPGVLRQNFFLSPKANAPSCIYYIYSCFSCDKYYTSLYCFKKKLKFSLPPQLPS